jgi:hypothetical protein
MEHSYVKASWARANLLMSSQKASGRVRHATGSLIEIEESQCLLERVRARAVFGNEKVGWDDLPPART